MLYDLYLFKFNYSWYTVFKMLPLDNHSCELGQIHLLTHQVFIEHLLHTRQYLSH